MQTKASDKMQAQAVDAAWAEVERCQRDILDWMERTSRVADSDPAVRGLRERCGRLKAADAAWMDAREAAGLPRTPND